VAIIQIRNSLSSADLYIIAAFFALSLCRYGVEEQNRPKYSGWPFLLSDDI
jgi:hypothetical protein